MGKAERIAVSEMISKYHEVCGKWSGLHDQVTDCISRIESLQPVIERLEVEALAIAQWLNQHDERFPQCPVDWEEQFSRRQEWATREKCSACSQVKRWYQLVQSKDRKVCRDSVVCTGQPNPSFPLRRGED
jgi:hypothetical protein